MKIEGTLRDAYVQRKRLIIPRKADGRVVVLTVSKEAPKEKNQFFDVAVAYEKPEALLSHLPKLLLKKLQTQPSMVVLNGLLKMNRFDAATPLQFTSDWNLIGKNSSKESERSPIATIDTPQGERVIVLCAVRPKGRYLGAQTQAPVSASGRVCLRCGRHTDSNAGRLGFFPRFLLQCHAQ